MDELFKTLPTLGVGGVLAAIMFYFYNKNTVDNTKKWEEIASQQSAQIIMLVGVIKENSVSNVTLGVLVKSLHDHLITARKLDDRRELGK